MKTCNDCLRLVEDWRYLKKHGIKPLENPMHLFSVNPRSADVQTVCTVDHVVTHPSRKACGAYKSRRAWNARIWLKYSLAYKLCDFYRRRIRIPLGGLRRPKPLLYQDAYNFEQDQIVPNSDPICPHCGEMPYSYVRCVFCGQRFEKGSSERK